MKKLRTARAKRGPCPVFEKMGVDIFPGPSCCFAQIELNALVPNPPCAVPFENQTGFRDCPWPESEVVSNDRLVIAHEGISYLFLHKSTPKGVLQDAGSTNNSNES